MEAQFGFEEAGNNSSIGFEAADNNSSTASDVSVVSPWVSAPGGDRVGMLMDDIWDVLHGISR